MITRFAPSPTGPLHLGHAYSALLAFDMARAAGGTFLLRIEDIDQSRARPEWEQQIYDDLAWLGIEWETPVVRQSERLREYGRVLRQMWWDGFAYACSCNRRDILAAASAPQEGAPLVGPDGIVYPGTCKNDPSERDHYPAPPPSSAIRFDWDTFPDGCTNNRELTFFEDGDVHGRAEIHVSVDKLAQQVGDFVLSRPAMGTSYHLAHVIDDAAQSVDLVVRGADLFDATGLHVALQRLLNLPTPRYWHHKLIRDDSGKRLAKRDDARAISLYRAEGHSPNDIRKMVGLPHVQ